MKQVLLQSKFVELQYNALNRDSAKRVVYSNVTSTETMFVLFHITPLDETTRTFHSELTILLFSYFKLSKFRLK